MAELASIVRVVSGTDYDNLTQGQKLAIFSKISSITYKTVIVDLIKEINTLGWGMFFKEPVQFGNGYRILTNGIGKVEDFSDDPRQRFPQTRNLLKDYENLIVDKAKLRTRITLNESQSSFYFKDLGKLQEYLSLSRKRLRDTMLLVFQDTMIRIFGNPQWAIRLAEDAPDYVALVDKIRGELKNSINITGSTIADKVKFIMKFTKLVTSMSQDAFNIGDDGSSDFEPVLNSVGLEDVVLVMSNLDYIDFSVEVQAPTYHKENFDWPKFKIIALPIPKGTFWLLDKNAFQIAPNRNVDYTDFYPNVLDTDFFHHEWMYMGVYPLAFGVKINFVDSGGQTIDDIITSLTNRYLPDADDSESVVGT